MRLGIIGQVGVGKQTIFEALTGITISPGDRNDDHIGTIDVPDDRIDYLSQLYQPKKTTHAQVEYLLPGFAMGGDSGRKETDPGGWTRIRNCDALILVLRNFTLYGMGDLAADLDFNATDQEMILADLLVVEKRLDRLAQDQKRGKKPSPEEYELLLRCKDALEAETPLRREPDLASAPLLRGFAFLSAKPLLVLVNNADEDLNMPELPEHVTRETCVNIRGQLERELTQMEADEAEMFFKEYQIENTAADRVIRHSYQILGLISFFTVGEDEVKAWTIHRDTLAVDAAGAIHSDIKKGFIRAEVLAYDDLKATGSFKESRKMGTVRLEGKTYPVQDGDIIHFRFNV
jgi:GTP-binding protein YchF